MKEVYIKYNPYKVETTLAVDDKTPPANSVFCNNKNKRLQEWVDDLPRNLCDDSNDQDLSIIFHGTALDMEDLRGSLECYSRENPGFKFSLHHIPAKEARDKEAKIQEVFVKIQSLKDNWELQDLNALTSPEVVDAFNNALNNEFEVFVVATMSAGKSTLINALLGRKLMPAKQEACTAIITRIKDVDAGDADAPYQAVAYDNITDGKRLETLDHLRPEDMERLNDDPRVRRIEVTGDIPFVSSSKTALVLIDTPGPNNARTRDHEKVQQQMLDNKAKPLILYIMTGEFGTNDDVAVLERVAKSMSSGGKQSRDRFLFVVNKLDGRTKEDGDLKEFLQNVRSNLELRGIPNPNIFPAAALPALNIRLLQTNPAALDEDDSDDTRSKIRKFNRRLHLEEEASLPSSIQAEINQALEDTRQAWRRANGTENENPSEALIHTGVPSIEAAIRQYVEKYAKTAKIKTIVDTFKHTLQRAALLERIENEITKNEETRQEINDQIRTIRKQMDNIKTARSFENQVEQTVKEIKEQCAKKITELSGHIFEQISSKIDWRINEKLELKEAENEVQKFHSLVKNLQDEFKDSLNKIIKDQIIETGNNLVEEYIKYIASLSIQCGTQLQIGIDLSQLTLNPLDKEALSARAISSLYKEEQVKSGEEWIENTNKRWWKPWTWGEEKGYWREIYKTHQFIEYRELSQKYFTPIQESLYSNGINAETFVEQQCKKIAAQFKNIFADLNGQLKDTLHTLEVYTTNENITEAELARAKRKREWLEDIQAEVNTILEI